MLNSTNAHRLLDEGGITYAIADRSLTILYMSRNLRALQGFDAMAAGQSLLDAVPELVGSEEEVAAILAGVSPRIYLPMVNREQADGRITYLNFTLLPHSQTDDRIDGILFVVVDISEMARIEQAVTQHRNELTLLRDQLSQQNMQISAANAELRRLDELKSKFVSIAAHELRSPLSTIGGYLDLLLNPDYGDLSQEQIGFTAAIRRSAERLLETIEQLLDLTRITSGRVEIMLTVHDLDEVLNSAVAEIAPLVTVRQQTLHVAIAQGLPAILCDVDRLTQVLHNLIANAAKYTPEGGEISVEAGRAEIPGQIQISVIDNGIGIPDADRAHIFDTFFRAGNVHRTGAGGAGLGLSITHALVELHGGEIWFESEVGVGTTFHTSFLAVEP